MLTSLVRNKYMHNLYIQTFIKGSMKNNILYYTNVQEYTVDSGCLAHALILKTVRKYALNKGLCAYNTRPHTLHSLV